MLIKFRGYVDSTYPGGLLGLLSRTHDEVWDFFQKLTWDGYEFEKARGTLGYLTHDEYIFHVTPHH